MAVDQRIEELARFVASTQWADIPLSVRARAKLVLLDSFGVILAGSLQPEVRRLTRILCTGTDLSATVFCRGAYGGDPRTVALLNGIAARSLELCEGHHYVSCQGGAQVVPGLLATAELLNSSGQDMLTALILGYEVAARFAAAMKAHPTAHQNGQAPLLGSIAASARLRGFNGADMSRAIRLGTTLMLTPSYLNAVAGATVLNVAGGMSGHAGALGPDLALAGFTAHDAAVEQALGGLVGSDFRADGLLAGLGVRWEITRNHFRLRACCNPINAALDALEDALADLSPTAQEISSIEVETYRFAAAMCNQSPPNSFGAKYSLPHAAAALIVRGDLGMESFAEAAVHDPLIRDLRRRVYVREDPAMTAQAPALKPARVTLQLTDGRRSIKTCEQTKRDLSPYTEPELHDKFRKLAQCVLSQPGVTVIEEAFGRADEWPDMSALIVPFKFHRLAERP